MTAAWELSKPTNVLQTTMSDGALINIRRHGNPGGARILVSHGCGLAADTYYPYWSLLLDDYDVFVVDLRSHGWNPPGDLRAQNVPTFVRDCEIVLRAIERNYGEEPVVGNFHSLSGLVALLHEEQWKGFAGLVLFDVPIMPPGGKPEDLVEIGETMSAAARRRRERFASKEEFASRIARSPVYRRLSQPTLDLIAETTLRPAQDGAGYELRCPREHEAQVLEYLFGWAMRVNVNRVSCPVKVIGADPTASYSFMPSMNLAELVGLDYDYLPESTHFLQLEEPEQCAEFVHNFMSRYGFN